MRTWSAWSINTWGLKATAESENDYVRSKRKGSSFVSEQTNVSLRLRMSLCFTACTFHMLKYACAFMLMLALACAFMLMLALLYACVFMLILALFICLRHTCEQFTVDRLLQDHGQHDALLSVDYFTLKSLLGELSCFNSLQFWYGDYDAGSKLCWKSWHR